MNVAMLLITIYVCVLLVFVVSFVRLGYALLTGGFSSMSYIFAELSFANLIDVYMKHLATSGKLKIEDLYRK